MSSLTSAPRMPRLLLAYLAFVSLGLPDGLIGVGWPSIRSDFGVPTESVGFVLAVSTAGYLASSVVAGFAIARVGVGWLLGGSTALAGLALAGYAVSPGLAVLTCCALVLGLGSGAVDSGMNAYAAGAFGPRHMNWLHAFFGLGVAFGPLIMTGVLGAGLGWRWGYAVVAVGQLVLACAFGLTVRIWADRRPAGEQPAVARPAPPPGAQPFPPPAAPVQIIQTLRLPTVWLSALAFVAYTAIEIGAGLWAFLLLTEGRGMTATAAGICVSGYWASLFAGRVVQGLVAERLGGDQVLRVSLVGVVIGAVLVAVPGSAWIAVAGLAVLGFAAAPVFPLLTLTTAERVGAAHADRVIGLQIAAGGLGAALIPAGIGALMSRISVNALGPALVVSAVGLLALCTAAARRAGTAFA